MDWQTELPFCRREASTILLDLNSCFATIEQQANPLLRGRPVAVAAYTTDRGCIVAPSVEAKREGVRVGMRVRDGRMLCPDLVVLEPDPNKYRFVHIGIKKILQRYTDKVVPRSIDEFYLELEGYPAQKRGMMVVGAEIKKRIREELGEWLSVSVGIGPNRFLAKTAASLKKPDGLEEITWRNFRKVYQRLTLVDLHGIKRASSARLNMCGVHTVWDLYQASVPTLKSAFHSVVGYYWYLRLRGWEVDEVEWGRKSFGAMYSLPKPLVSVQELSPILCKLVEKTSSRMRRAGFATGGVHVGLLYRDHSFWHQGRALAETLFDSRDMYRTAFRIMTHSPYQKPVANLAVSFFALQKFKELQLDLFGQRERSRRVTQAVDKINTRYGNFVITPAVMLGAKELVPDRVGFGSIKGLEEMVLGKKP